MERYPQVSLSKASGSRYPSDFSLQHNESKKSSTPLTTISPNLRRSSRKASYAAARRNRELLSPKRSSSKSHESSLREDANRVSQPYPSDALSRINATPLALAEPRTVVASSLGNNVQSDTVGPVEPGTEVTSRLQHNAQSDTPTQSGEDV